MSQRRGMTATGMGVVAVMLVAGPGRGQPPHEPQGSPRPDGPRVIVDFSAGAGRVSARVFAREPVRVLLEGKPRQHYTLQWGHKDTVIGQMKGQLDPAGRGQVTLRVPDVRVRTECTLLLLLGGGRRDRPIVLFPSQSLTIAAKRVREERVGVIDARRSVHQALRAEGAEHEVLATQIQRGVFDGGMVVVAGFDEATALRRVCATLEGRIRHGMTAVVVNPPVGWAGWEARCDPAIGEKAGSVRFAALFGSLLRPSDIGSPGRRALHLGKPWTSLAWREKIKPDRDVRTGAHRPWIAARPIAAGHVIVAQAPELDDPHRSPVGRAILNEVILHALRLRTEKRTPGAKEKNHVSKTRIGGLRPDRPVPGDSRLGR